jgi:hypothetical protein
MPFLVHMLDVSVLVRLPVAVFSLAFRKSMPMSRSGCILPMTHREHPYICARVQMHVVVRVLATSSAFGLLSRVGEGDRRRESKHDIISGAGFARGFSKGVIASTSYPPGSLNTRSVEKA